MSLDLSPLWLSLRVSVIATAAAGVLGTVCAYIMSRKKRKLGFLWEGIFTLPLVLPPTVVGFFLILFLGRNGLLGKWLYESGIQIIFTWQSAIISAFVVAFPLMYRAAKGGFLQVDPDLIRAAKSLGMSPFGVFFRIAAPLAKPGIISGLVLSFARALGEFGATMMIAGNIPKKTQTIPTAIYFSVAAGDMRSATVWVIIITLVSFISLGLLGHFSGEEGRR